MCHILTVINKHVVNIVNEDACVVTQGDWPQVLPFPGVVVTALLGYWVLPQMAV